MVVHAGDDAVRERARGRVARDRHGVGGEAAQGGTVRCVRAGEDRAEAWPALGARGGQVVWARPVMPPAERLDAGVRERLEGLAREEDRRRHATGAALSDALARIHGGAGAHVVRARGAAPVVEGARGELYVSVAHGGAWVVVAVCAVARVGVDVEPLGREWDAGVAEQVLAPAEREGVRTGAELLVAWTRKEAVVKATGDGLRVDPREVVVSAPDAPPRLLAYAGRPERVGATAIAAVAPPGDAHVGAVAVLAPEPSRSGSSTARRCSADRRPLDRLQAGGPRGGAVGDRPAGRDLRPRGQRQNARRAAQHQERGGVVVEGRGHARAPARSARWPATRATAAGWTSCGWVQSNLMASIVPAT